MNDLDKLIQQLKFENEQISNSLDKSFDDTRMLFESRADAPNNDAESLILGSCEEMDALVSPWLQKGSMNLLYAPTGLGKTHFALSLAYSCAIGQDFLCYSVPKALKVLYIDGEMTRPELRERLTAIKKADKTNSNAENLQILSAENFGGEMPDLANELNQAEIYTPHTIDKDLIILDNEGVLAYKGERESSDEPKFQRLKKWMLKLKNAGKTVLLLHHAGKSGDQLGTSARTQPMSTILKLKKRSIADNKKGFFLEFEKTRGVKQIDNLDVTFDMSNEFGMLWEYGDYDIVMKYAIQSAYAILKNWGNVAYALSLTMPDLMQLRLKLDITEDVEEIEKPRQYKSDAERKLLENTVQLPKIEDDYDF